MKQGSLEHLQLMMLRDPYLTVTDLLELMEDFEQLDPALIDDLERDYYQAYKDVLLIKALTGR